MASTHRTPSDTLKVRLKSQPHRFEFFQLVRLLCRTPEPERLNARRDATRLSTRLGRDEHPGRELIRFRSAPTFEFPWAAVLPREQTLLAPGADLEVETQTDVIAVLMGLPGASGVLPEHYTELLLERARAKEQLASDKDPPLQALLDVLSHRSVSFFYRAWGKYRLPINWEQAREAGVREEDHVTDALRALLGLRTTRVAERLGINENFPLYFGGHYARRTRSAAALTQVLIHYLRLPVEIRQFQGCWLLLDKNQQTRLPAASGKNGQHHSLGRDAIAGDKLWHVSSKFRVRIGPVNEQQFRTLMPEGSLLKEVYSVVRLYAGIQLAFDVQVILQADGVPRARLVTQGNARVRLSRNAWLRRRDLTRDADDAVFRYACSASI